MEGSDKTLVYFIDNVHSSFVINDIRELSRRFKRIRLFSMDPIENGLVFPENVEVCASYLDWNKLNAKAILASHFFAIASIYIQECIKLKKLLPLKNSVALLASNIYKATVITKLLASTHSKKEETLFYSFWFYDCIFLAWLAKKGIAKQSYVRAHGGDLFEERITLKGKILFRHFQFKNIQSVYSISEAGKAYLQAKYPAYAAKIKMARLGSYAYKDAQSLLLNAITDRFTLVSCGNVLNAKRIYLVAEMLQDCTMDLDWIHFGKIYEDDKYQRFVDAVELLKKKPNVSVTIRGSVPHAEIMEFYKMNYVDLFISLSEAEGIPVTMMEAISFGIPVLSTDVGGCREIVTEKTGILVKKEITVQEVRELLHNFRASEKNKAPYRTGVRKFWEENFNIEKNYDSFCNSIVKT